MDSQDSALMALYMAFLVGGLVLAPVLLAGLRSRLTVLGTSLCWSHESPLPPQAWHKTFSIFLSWLTIPLHSFKSVLSSYHG